MPTTNATNATKATTTNATTVNTTMAAAIFAEQQRIFAQLTSLCDAWNTINAGQLLISRLGSGAATATRPLINQQAPVMPTGTPTTTRVRARGRPRGATAATASTKAKTGTSLSNACAAVIAKHPGSNSNQILAFLKSEYGLTPLPNHLGVALQRHRKAGRLQETSGIWYPPAGSMAA
jgi:hypothetical protein